MPTEIISNITRNMITYKMISHKFYIIFKIKFILNRLYLFILNEEKENLYMSYYIKVDEKVKIKLMMKHVDGLT
jgi:hypothetical protein